jgi:hypothetical protein
LSSNHLLRPTQADAPLNSTPLKSKFLATILLLCYNRVVPHQPTYFKAFALCLTFSLLMNRPAPADQVILIHGLARSAKTMEPMAKALQEAGHKTMILDYPSRHKTIRALVDDYERQRCHRSYSSLYSKRKLLSPCDSQRRRPSITFDPMINCSIL